MKESKNNNHKQKIMMIAIISVMILSVIGIITLIISGI